MKVDLKKELFEYRFHYHFENSIGFSDRYFLARDYNEALQMFQYACNKRRLAPELDKVEMWNRWAERWENVDILRTDPSLN